MDENHNLAQSVNTPVRNEKECKIAEKLCVPKFTIANILNGETISRETINLNQNVQIKT